MNPLKMRAGVPSAALIVTVTFLPIISSNLTEASGESRSNWYSKGREISSMPEKERRKNFFLAPSRGVSIARKTFLYSGLAIVFSLYRVLLLDDGLAPGRVRA